MVAKSRNREMNSGAVSHPCDCSLCQTDGTCRERERVHRLSLEIMRVSRGKCRGNQNPRFQGTQIHKPQ